MFRSRAPLKGKTAEEIAFPDKGNVWVYIKKVYNCHLRWGAIAIILKALCQLLYYIVR